uniref:Uncharacterized protein n=1 Tax=Candidatus Kentrum sp. LFY TaxID=2126342 RepID=A0A450UAT6_9GAMM|nr:MAG: hypothetical protein BECKLFY1418A_GA0070994_100717 [Candidatus Kentron sp. LFY]
MDMSSRPERDLLCIWNFSSQKISGRSQIDTFQIGIFQVSVRQSRISKLRTNEVRPDQ